MDKPQGLDYKKLDSAGAVEMLHECLKFAGDCLLRNDTEDSWGTIKVGSCLFDVNLVNDSEDLAFGNQIKIHVYLLKEDDRVDYSPSTYLTVDGWDSVAVLDFSDGGDLDRQALRLMGDFNRAIERTEKRQEKRKPDTTLGLRWVVARAIGDTVHVMADDNGMVYTFDSKAEALYNLEVDEVELVDTSLEIVCMPFALSQ